jgi:hypothetical protein
MAAVNAVLQSRSVAGGHAIEVDFQFDDDSRLTLQILFQVLPTVMHAIWNAAAIAETTQRQSAGERMMAVVLPYRMQDMRTGHSPDGTVVADFRTAQGPVQIAMTPDQTRLTIERLTTELANLGRRQFPQLS